MQQEWLTRSGLFDANHYTCRNLDLPKSACHIQHYLTYGWKEDRSPNCLFSPDFYRLQTTTTLPLLLHYHLIGWKLGYDPSELFSTNSYLDAYPDVKQANINPLSHFLRHGIKEGRDIFPSKFRRFSFKQTPLVSIIIPVYKPDIGLFFQTIQSVFAQTYSNWEVCICDDATSSSVLDAFLQSISLSHGQIKVIRRHTNGHICRATNDALTLASGNWLVFLDQDDLLATHALERLVLEINKYPDTQLIYSDEDKITKDGRRYDPYYKPDWSRELLYQQNFFAHLGAYRTELVARVGRFRPGYEGSQDYDLLLRCIAITPDHAIRHIPEVLYHWRSMPDSGASNPEAKPYALTSARQALIEHVAQHVPNAAVEAHPLNPLWHRLRRKPQHSGGLSIVICTHNNSELLKRCLHSIINTISTPFEFLIVNHDSTEPELTVLLESVSKVADVSVFPVHGPFSFSAFNNFAAKSAKFSNLLFLNNDTEAVTHNWCDELLATLDVEGVGAVGARLLFTDDTVQHAGVILGMGDDRSAAHPFQFTPRTHAGYFGLSGFQRELSAVTGAFLGISSSLFKMLGGFNEDFKVDFNDVDLCLRVRSTGAKVIYNPYIVFYHHESASRSRSKSGAELDAFIRERNLFNGRYGSQLFNDPFYNPNLSLVRPYEIK